MRMRPAPSPAHKRCSRSRPRMRRASAARREHRTALSAGAFPRPRALSGDGSRRSPVRAGPRVVAGSRPSVAAGGRTHARRRGARLLASAGPLPRPHRRAGPGNLSRWAPARPARWWRRRWRCSDQTASSLPAPAATTRSAPPMRPATSTSGPPTRKPSARPCWRRRRRASRRCRGDWPGPAAVVANGETASSRPATTTWPSPARWSSFRRMPRGAPLWAQPPAARVRERHGLETAAATLNRALDAALAGA